MTVETVGASRRHWRIVMSEYPHPAGRRKFLKLVGGTVVLAPLAGLIACSGGDESPPAGGGESKPAADQGNGSGAGADMARETEQAAGSAQQATQEATEEAAEEAAQTADASGGGRPKLSLDDPQAKSLGYVHDATNVDQSKYGRYEPGQACSNCALFQAKGDEQWAGCSIFPGKLVNAAGWCSAWAPKA